jgi:hypothetical protein
MVRFARQPLFGALILLTLPLQTALAAGHDPAPPPGSAPSPAAIVAVRANSAIVVDGRLTEEAWGPAAPATTFTQREPREGQPASERTEVRVVFDDDALYVGARLFDREPGRIVGRLARRDDEDQSDALIVLLDPHHDHRTGFRFRINAAGAMADALLYNDTDRDASWDGVWDGAVRTDAEGWTAEIRVPFSQLRFTAGDHEWGINVVRYLQRHNEEAWLELVPLKETRLVSLFGHLQGLKGIRPRSHLDLLPYVTTGGQWIRTSPSASPFGDGTSMTGNAGLDVKWGLTSRLVLDATVNPDFGQVEVDPAVVNLTAFETFYQEKRPFFLEGADLFNNFGRDGLVLYGRFGARYPSLYYSRRIGRAPQGSADGDFVDRPDATTVLAAAKLSGRLSSDWSVAILNALTGRERARVATGQSEDNVVVEPLTNYFAARTQREFGRRGSIGFIATSVERALPAEMSQQVASRAYTFGSDGHVFLNGKKTWVVTGSMAGSWLSGDAAVVRRLQRSSARYFQRPDAEHLAESADATSMNGWSGQVNLNRTTGNVLVDLAAWGISPGFESNDFGYSPAADRFGTHLGLVVRKTRPDRYTRSREFQLIKYYTWNFGGEKQSDITSVQVGGTFTNYWSLYTSVNYQPHVFDDRLTRGGPMVQRLPYTSVDLYASTDRRKTVSFEGSGGYGTNRQGGISRNMSVSVRVRPSASVTIDAGPSVSGGHTLAQYVRSVADTTAAATLGGRYVFGDLDLTEWSMPIRINWTMSPRMSLQVYAQPLLAVGDYTQFKELRQPRTFTFARFGADAGTIAHDPASDVYTVDPDTDGPGRAFTFANPDYNFKSLRMNAVFRWEWRLGSTFYAVWTQQREDYTSPGLQELGRDVRSMLRAPGDNVFMIKVAYWFSR